jgi:hypothetical protein
MTERITRLADDTRILADKLEALATYLDARNTPGTEGVLAAAKRAALELNTLTIELEQHT